MKRGIARRGAAALLVGSVLVPAAAAGQAEAAGQTGTAPKATDASAPKAAAAEPKKKAWCRKSHQLTLTKCARNVQRLPRKCGKKLVGENTANGPGYLRLDISKSRSSTWSASGEVGAGSVSAVVGFDVTKSYTVSDGYTYKVPRGKHAKVRAYTRYAGKKFDIYTMQLGDKGQVKSGKGKAYKPVGVCFKGSSR